MSTPRLPAIFVPLRKPASNVTPISRFPGKKQPLKKFVMSLRNENFNILSSIAGTRGISVQELLRAVIIPEWAETMAKKTAAVQTTPARTF